MSDEIELEIEIIDDLLDTCAEILFRYKDPVHWDTLFKELVERGLAEVGAIGEQRIYNKIYSDIRRNGQMSRFRKTGRAMFCISQNFDPEKHVLSAPNKSKHNPKGESYIRPAVPRVCGRCKHIEYSGIQELHMRDGVCGEFALSGRVGVQSTETGCTYWDRMSDDERRRVHARSNELHILVLGINIAVQRQGKRGAGGSVQMDVNNIRSGSGSTVKAPRSRVKDGPVVMVTIPAPPKG